jgi:hypothetical protein
MEHLNSLKGVHWFATPNDKTAGSFRDLIDSVSIRV